VSVVIQQSFIGNGRETNNETRSVSRKQILNKQEWIFAASERFGKHVPEATDKQATEK
jgi:hypothetical protein